MGRQGLTALRAHLGRFVIAVAVVAAVAAHGAPPSPAPKSAADAKSATTLITDYYQSILRRAPDPGGLAFWEAQAGLIQSLGANVNETWRGLAITFFQSPEYRAFGRDDDGYLQDLYATFFRRAPDSGGLAHWKGQMQSGLTREGVLLWFLFSAEFDGYMKGLFGDTRTRAEVDVVVDFYRGFLNRLPDEGGLRYWVARFRAAQCTSPAAVVREADSISSLFLASPDYTARGRGNPEYVDDLYNAFLRRGVDLGGFGFWRDRLAGGMSREEARRAFLASAEFQARVQAVVAQGCATLAEGSSISATVVDQSVSPFLATLELRGMNLDAIAVVTFSVTPKPGAVSRPVQATYSHAYLSGAGYAAAGGGYRVPVFGLYAAHANEVVVFVSFSDESVKSVSVQVAAGPFDDPTGVYATPTLRVKRQPGAHLGFDYFYVKSQLTTPLVIDTDGEVRWWVPGATVTGLSSLFVDNGFMIGSGTLRWVRLELDGRTTETTIASNTYAVHHNIDPGRTGSLVEVDDMVNGVIDFEHILLEVARDGTVIGEWRLGDLISRHMAANGDDPSAFVQLGRDWFHMNAAAYDARDDSLILSSRESFLIKINYRSGEILWILGDPTKYWHTFPSLRAKSLTLASPGLYPIGQHSVSVTPRGTVLVFNNGAASNQNPAGTPRGESRTFSAVSEYEIDPIGWTAREVSSFDYDKTILSRFCSSAYESGNATLVSYSQASNGTRARLVGLDSSKRVAFDFEYKNSGCNTSWNAVPVKFEYLVFP